ncbi:MAG: response regulator transcription factor [Flavobacteriales bacterium]|jgi:DNA-binding NarL/FixJ family response regulator|nr:response regulator transcription factor [Flavobacteriales bacterium]
MSAIRILLVDDQSIILDGLESLLGNMAGFHVVARASDGQQAVALARELRPDVVLMDISMPEMDGIEATRALLKCCKESRVLVLSMYDHKEFVRELLDAGAAGYVVKNTGKEELARAIRAVAAGETYLGQEVHQALGRADRFKDREGEVGYHALTKREKEIVRMICAELSTHDIAAKLFISSQTVETHRKNILHKLDIRNATGLVKYAMERGWVID